MAHATEITFGEKRESEVKRQPATTTARLRNQHATARNGLADRRSAPRINLAIGINHLGAARLPVIGPRCYRTADHGPADNGAARRPARDARITHGRQGTSDTSFGRRDESVIDVGLAVPEQPAGENNGGSDKHDIL